ncbi:hypothetical protein CONPUDRAFT_144251 [Coniophora puteana RWD-64-598 SS2]|uniref:Uncharacterized protein n=1 Tax=Coniophora puteana (strain RWD-64-598) TaxID=741705 RepID=A0A5M3MQQ0_CONPW|nr:uncharacterized protein CONPUDRAFT_144251 [Coniophora puteana RWD-64-598 SS2]EIW81509.1 hypothetical protein CONPUDRAFT_144251 [Coniophora puteana RWD-64-598 SS2]
MSASTLPPEIVLSILEKTYYQPDGRPDQPLLTSAALVCTAWSAPAQALLFRTVTSLKATNVTAFYAAVGQDTKRARQLGVYVRSLEISVGNNANLSCSVAFLVNVLMRCPRLYELALHTYGIHELPEDIIQNLQGARLDGLRALSLSNFGVQSPIVFQLLAIWPHVQFFKLGSEVAAVPPGMRRGIWRQPASAAQNANEPPSATDEIQGSPTRLYDLVLSRSPSATALGWLLASSSGTLRILDVRDGLGPLTRAVILPHAPHLRSLRFLRFSLDSIALLRECTHLEEFVLYHIPTVVPVAPHVPRTVQHFKFRNPIFNHSTKLQPVLDVVRALPNLSIVTCDSLCEELEDFGRMREACEERGIEMERDDKPIWVHEDPVIPRRLPRRKSVSNFALMV